MFSVYLKGAALADLVAHRGGVVDEGEVSLGGLLDPHEAGLRAVHHARVLDHLQHVGVHLTDRVVPHAEPASGGCELSPANLLEGVGVCCIYQ